MLEIDNFFVKRKIPDYMGYHWLKKYLGKRGNSEGKPTQADLARLLDIPDNYVTKIFTGERQIQIDELIPVAQLLNISVEEVLTGVPAAPKQEIITQQYDTLGLLNAVGLLFSILIVKKTITKGELEEVIRNHIAHFKRRNLSGAKAVTEELLDALNLQPYQSMLPKEQKPLKHLPA